MNPDDFLARFLDRDLDHLQPFQADFLRRLEQGGPFRMDMCARPTGRRFAERCIIEGYLLQARESELRGDDLHVWLPDGTYIVLIGAGRILDKAVLAEAEDALRARL